MPGEAFDNALDDGDLHTPDDLRSPERPARPFRVLKFGGTSLVEPRRVDGVVELVKAATRTTRPVVVVSAVGNATDLLLRLLDETAQRGGSPDPLRSVLEDQFRALLEGVIPESERPPHLQRLRERLGALDEILKGVAILGEASPRVRDRALAMGEEFSADLTAAALQRGGLQAQSIDPRKLILTDGRHGKAQVHRPRSFQQIRDGLSGLESIPVVAGFVGAAPEGSSTTLGRGGSDLTATLIAAALDAEAVELWTDVDGVLTADPRTVPHASLLPRLGYDELTELARFGAGVVCPSAIGPARDAGIPIHIRSTLAPDRPGTVVTQEAGREENRSPVQGVSALSGAALLRLEGVDRLGVNESAERLFRALGRCEVEPLLFGQDSSGHALSMALPSGRLHEARAAVEKEFRRDLDAGVLRLSDAEEDCSVLAAVGTGMRNTPGVAGRVFRAMGQSGINVRAIAQGASERNISWVVAGRDEKRALRAVHDSLVTLRPRVDFRIAVLGAGRVGSELLDQLARHGPEAFEAVGVRPVLVGVARSRVAALDPEGIDPRSWKQTLERGNARPEEVLTALEGAHEPGAVVDCTADEELGQSYPRLLRAGLDVVTANKIPFSGAYAGYRQIQEAAETRGGRVGMETTVGAGLPMIQTVARLHSTGDRILELEGALSGTLTSLFSAVNEGTALSRALEDARSAGLTEPDPREDLGLSDVARKLLILARTAGFPLEPDDVTVEPFIDPAVLNDPDAAAFRAALPDIDARLSERSRECARNGTRLAVVARFDGRGGRVGLEEVDAQGPFARLRGTENALRIRTVHYDEHPLVIQGPGAGPGVTAAGLLADLLVSAERYAAEARRP